MEPTVWSFDIGKSSLGEAVRNANTNEFEHVESWLIPEDFASTKPAKARRRMKRTRDAHKAREAWLDHVWCEAGQEPIHRDTLTKDPLTRKWVVSIPGDPRLKREFAAEGDDTCYTSSLLRIKLLRGEKLAPWQIFKALFSAIQRRGYDPDIPWKTSERSSKDAEKEEGEIRKRVSDFEKELKAMTSNESFRLPCYYQAWKMGLWNPEDPETLQPRITFRAQSIRNVIMPRSLVEKEILLLATAAGKQIKSLAGKEKFLLWGPGETPYASTKEELREKFQLRLGGSSDHQAVMGQKIPRFDNRIIEKCVLIPRLNVCKIRDDDKGFEKSRIVFETTFLLKLKNLRVEVAPGVERDLTAAELNTLFNDPTRKGYQYSKTAWRKLCEKTLHVRPLPNHEEVEAPRTSGRSRFSRPALELVKRLILSGLAPKAFHAEELKRLNGNTNPLKGLVPDDLKFLLKMGETWDGIYIPNQKLEALAQAPDNREAAIRSLIGSQNDPIVRHRLETLYTRIKKLEERFGTPREVILEFIREDFMGKKAVIEYRKFLKDRETARKQARAQAIEAGATARSAGLKMELLAQQGSICLYTGDALCPSELESYEIEHIVPRALGGPDAMFNYVVTKKATNAEKDNRTPHEWLSGTEGWTGYLERVRSRGKALPLKKVRLLTQADAAEIADKYTALAETAWIAKLSQTLMSIHFGWYLGVDSKGNRRIKVVNGSLTAKIRRRYNLNSLLAAGDLGDETETEKKNRDDKRHHALDAMVINFIDPAKKGHFQFPEGIERPHFEKELKKVFPKNLCFAKPTLRETNYGIRGPSNSAIIVKRQKVVDLAGPENPEEKPSDKSKAPPFNLSTAKKNAGKILDPVIRERLLTFLETSPSAKEWQAFCQCFRQKRKDGTEGSQITRITIGVGSPEFYKDLAKAHPGQPGSGAWRTEYGLSKGQLVYLDGKQKPKVRTIRVYESRSAVEKELTDKNFSVIGSFRSGCIVELTSPVSHHTGDFPPGRYILKSLRSDAYALLADASGRLYPYRSLAALLEGGFRRPQD